MLYYPVVCHNTGNRVKNIKGKAITPEEKNTIVVLKSYFDRNKAGFGLNESSVQLVSEALGMGLATVNRVMAAYNKDPSSIMAEPQLRGRPAHAVDASFQEIIRSYIRAANLQGTYITLETIRDFLQEKTPDKNEIHISTLARTLDRWGFEFGKGKRTQHLKEKDYVVSARHRYLRKMKANRLNGSDEKTIRPEVYLDESYVNKNHSNDFVWYSNEDGPWIQKPTGNGERLIIVNAITKNGWVTGAKLVFKSTKKTGDYHGQMNGDVFEKWFKEQLVTKIPPKSIIVMDNAAYHKVLAKNSAPTSASLKNEIRNWLENNKIPCSPDCLKTELIEVLNKVAPAPTYVIDEIAREHGHEVVRTPPYHPELQPIEICWGVVKNEVARNCNFTMQNLEIQLEKCFEKVTSETCLKIIKKIRKVEDKFWEEDDRMENNDENCELGELDN